MTPQSVAIRLEAFIIALSREKKASEHTQKAYSRDLRQFITYWQAQHDSPGPLQRIIEKFFASLASDGVTASSIARKVSCLNSFKKYLKQQGITLPIELKRPYSKLKDPLSLPVKEIDAVLDLLTFDELATPFPHRDKAIIELIFSTGITCSELVQLEIQNIDFSARSIIIRGKRKREREVPLSARVIESIKMYIDTERAEAKSRYEFLFLNHRNTGLTSRTVQRICALFRGVLAKKRIVTPQVLRTSYAAHLIKNGAEIETVQELLGHKTRISTERYKKVRT